MFTQFALNTQLLGALDGLQIEKPTEIQAATLPPALEGKDLLVSAATGSGKTLAYLLPLANRLLQPADVAKRGSRALILVPTRELALQVFKLCERLCKSTGLRCVLIMGGQETNYQAALLRREPDIIVATPGRLLEHLRTGAAQLDDIEFVVIDEADRMLDMGFREDVTAIVEKTGADRQTMLLSATLKHSGVGAIAADLLKNPVTINKSGASYDHENIHQKMLLSDDLKHKQKQLLWIIDNTPFEKAIVFCNTRSGAQELVNFLKFKDIRTDLLHGEIRQDDRKKVVRNFTQGSFNLLVATDVAARGLDIAGVELIVNFDVPFGGDDYVHRVGRTGRAGNQGTAITLVTANEWNLTASIQRFVGASFERMTISELKGTYTGPKKVKSSGKAASTKAKKSAKTKATAKVRLRDKKAKGKRRVPTSTAEQKGLAPPKKRS